MDVFALCGIVLYFFLLFAERLLAVIFSIWSGGPYAVFTGFVFNYIAYGITVISLIAGTVLFMRLLPGLFKALFTKNKYPFEEKYKQIVIAVVVMLYGGMMHTGMTIPGLQFAAYGFLIGSMIVRTVEACKEGVNKFAAIVSVIYLTLFSMTVPVCYLSLQEGVIAVLFFIVEFAAVFVLVPFFGIMLYRLYTKGVTDFSFYIPAVMVVLSGLTVALKWMEEINWFVLIFMVLTVVFYLACGLIAKKKAE